MSICCTSVTWDFEADVCKSNQRGLPRSEIIGLASYVELKARVFGVTVATRA